MHAFSLRLYSNRTHHVEQLIGEGRGTCVSVCTDIAPAGPACSMWLRSNTNSFPVMEGLSSCIKLREMQQEQQKEPKAAAP